MCIIYSISISSAEYGFVSFFVTHKKLLFVPKIDRNDFSRMEKLMENSTQKTTIATFQIDDAVPRYINVSRKSYFFMINYRDMTAPLDERQFFAICNEIDWK